MRHWHILAKPDTKKVSTLTESLGIDSLLCQLLVQRGIDTFDKAKSFFRPEYGDLHNPFLMKDMDKAVSRILLAIKSGERIMVYGDYDVDGTSSVAMFSSYISSFYHNVITYIPDRYIEGYGISSKGIDKAKSEGVGLIVALDCGIKSVDKVDYARQLNIDFIICDHHLPGDLVPKASAILNPKQSDCLYPYKYLCGCGIGYKFMQAIARQTKQNEDTITQYLDLVLIAIAADIVPMTGENRVLAYLGMQCLQQQKRLGLKALLPKDIQKINISDIVFKIAPHINAAGRIAHANISVQLLSETSESKVKRLADVIIQINNNRKELDRSATEQALQLITDYEEDNDYTTVVKHQKWHRGVVGIVASRLIEHHHRPTIVLAETDELLIGSGRSIAGFDLYNAINHCAKYLMQFGGHNQAVGLSLLPKHYDAFKRQFEDYVREHLPKKHLIPKINIDARINLQEINPKFLRILKQFSPFGPKNMNPIFYMEKLKAIPNSIRKVGKEQEHLSLMLTQEAYPQPMKAIGFGLGNKIDIANNPIGFKAVFSVEENTWKKRQSIELRLRDIDL